MAEQPTFNRRRVLELSGVGAGLAIAGCTGQVDDENGGDELDDDERRVTVPIQIDQEAIQGEAEELQSQVENEEISEEEAQEQLEELEAELADEAMGAAEEAAESLGLVIEDDIELESPQGSQIFILVSGSATGLIDFVEDESVRGLLSAETFAQIEAQQELQEQQGDEVPVEQTQ